jgi:hypothetical protein
MPQCHPGDVTAPRWARAAFGPRAANRATCARMLTFVGVTAERVLECLGREWAQSGGWLRTGGGLSSGSTHWYRFWLLDEKGR